MRKGFIVRERSLSSLPSRQLSVSQYMQQKSLALRNFQTKTDEESKIIKEKDEDISKLKVNLDHALKMAVNSTVEGSRAKQESMRAAHTKLHYEKKCQIKQQELRQQRQLRMQMETKNIEIEHQKQKLGEEAEKQKKMKRQAQQKVKELQQKLQQIDFLQQKVKEIPPLVSRIKNLENSIREVKLDNNRVNKEIKRVESEKQQLEQKLKNTKPYQQQLQERIAYLERVNLQIERKMEDFYKREHDYKKEIQHYKNSLAKMTAQKTKFKGLYEQTSQKLQQKIQEIKILEEQVAKRNQQIEQLTKNLQMKSEQVEKLEVKLQETAEYYKGVSQENAYLKQRNKALQAFEDEVRRTIKNYIKVSEEANLYIVSRNTVINSLEQKNKLQQKIIDQLQRKFAKLDKCFESKSQKGETEIKESYYQIIRENSKLKIEKKQLTADFDEKIMKYGEERDSLSRKVQLYSQPIPDDKHLFQAIISDKTEEIIMLESSNDQLLKLKKQNQQNIVQLQKQRQEHKKEIMALKLKASDLFRVKKEMQEANKKMQRYQTMIEEQKQTIQDVQQQAQVLRNRTKMIEQKNFNLDLENKNNSFKIKQYEHVMKQLDIEYLTAKKTQNQKNSHVLTDAVEKMQTGIDSLAFYFSCCYCGQFLNNPITLALCGHNYCSKCQNAYSEYCYECDTGQPIQKVYSSKFLKETAGKYKFLLMVVKQAKNNLIKINTK